jgi:hypothetical protein
VYNTDGYYHINATSQEDQLQVHLQLHAQWKYLLVGKDGESHDYKMTEFATLVENMTYNMQNATLYELDADGIVNIAPETLNTKIITHIQVGLIGKDINFNTSQITPKDPVNGIVLGDLTVAQIMPRIRGVLVVCDGGNETVIRDIVKNAVVTVLDINSKKVCVVGGLN